MKRLIRFVAFILIMTKIHLEEEEYIDCYNHIAAILITF
jgi:hypothetical protein